MHIYVNGKEQAVTVAAGTANPRANTETQPTSTLDMTQQIEIDQLQISNTDQQCKISRYGCNGGFG